LYGFGETIDESLARFITEETAEMQTEYPLWPAEEEVIKEQSVLLHSMLFHYNLWRKSAYNLGYYRDENLKFISVESDFSVPLRDSRNRVVKGVMFSGRFDGVVKHLPTETYWLFESKTTRSIGELQRTLVNDEQSAGYLLAAQELYGVKIEGVLYNIMRKRAPQFPTVLQSGFLSTASKADVSIDIFIYAAAQAHECTWEEAVDLYPEHIAYLDGRPNTYFARIPVRKSKHVLKQVRANLFYTAKEMISSKTRLYPSPGWMNCNFCSFRSLCLTLDSGDKASFKVILQEEFRTRRFESKWKEEENGGEN